MDVTKDTHAIRLCDLTPFDTIKVRCTCGLGRLSQKRTVSSKIFITGKRPPQDTLVIGIDALVALYGRIDEWCQTIVHDTYNAALFNRLLKLSLVNLLKVIALNKAIVSQKRMMGVSLDFNSRFKMIS
jgi:hypothetical protein